MKQHRLVSAIALAGLVGFGLAGCKDKEEASASPALNTAAEKASYGIGLNLGRSLTQDGLDKLDSKAVALGIDDALSKTDPRVSDEELMKAFEELQAQAEAHVKAQSEKALADGQAFLAENGKREGVVTTESGLQYEIITSADGAQPGADDVVTVHYHGTLTDGTVFDSSVDRGTPIQLRVDQVIPGWVEGLQLMHVGEKAKLFIPSELAYGEQSPSPKIPANSVLVFEIELQGIQGDDANAAEAPKAE